MSRKNPTATATPGSVFKVNNASGGRGSTAPPNPPETFFLPAFSREKKQQNPVLKSLGMGGISPCFRTNPALIFDREKTRGFRLNIAAGTAVRFEPGQNRIVELVAYAGERKVYGFNAEIMGSLEVTK